MQGEHDNSPYKPARTPRPRYSLNVHNEGTTARLQSRIRELEAALSHWQSEYDDLRAAMTRDIEAERAEHDAALATAGEKMRERAAKVARDFADAARISSAVLHDRREVRVSMTNARLAELIADEISALPLNKNTPDPQGAMDGDSE